MDLNRAIEDIVSNSPMTKKGYHEYLCEQPIAHKITEDEPRNDFT